MKKLANINNKNFRMNSNNKIFKNVTIFIKQCLKNKILINNFQKNTIKLCILLVQKYGNWKKRQILP